MSQRVLLRWLISAVAIFVAIQVVPGIEAPREISAILVLAGVFGLVNAVIRPILRILTCPLILLTLGLFTFVINAVMLAVTAWASAWISTTFGLNAELIIADPFWWNAFIGALVISMVSLVLSLVIRAR